MNVGDRVLYVENRPIILARDLGVVIRIDDESGDPVIRFDDGEIVDVDEREVAVVEEDPKINRLF